MFGCYLQLALCSFARTMDCSILPITLAPAAPASMLAGIFPAWRALHVAPALQLKSQ